MAVVCLTSCPECGRIELPLSEVTLRLCYSDRQASYAFRCSCCKRATSLPASDAVTNVLLAAGARFETWQLPAELKEPKPNGPPITFDDILQFHERLQDDRWRDDLERLNGG